MRFKTAVERRFEGGIIILMAAWGLGWGILGSCPGAEIRVEPSPNDSSRPIAMALARAQKGDTVVLGPGVYREHVVLEKEVTLKGEKGASLDGSVPAALSWKPVGPEMPGVFEAAVPKRPEGLLVGGLFVAELRFDRAQKEGEWHWKTLLRVGPPLSQFKEIRALWIYHPKEQKIYARLPDGVDPSGLPLSLVTSDRPLVKVSNVQGAVVEGLELSRSATGVLVDESASNCIIRSCRITSYEDTGIALTGGASGCLVEDCSITRGALEEWAPSLKHSRGNYEIWRIHKDVGKYDRIGINLFRAGVGNRILNNTLDRVFDGICVGDYKTESLDQPLTDPAHGQGTVISGNLIENTRDSGIELGAACIDVHVYGNTLRRTHGGFRFKVPRIGPVFIHHNRLLAGSPFNFWFSMDASPAEGYVYHNTIVGDKPALAFLLKGQKRGFTASGWHFINNLVVSREGFLEPPSKEVLLDFKSRNNLCSGGGSPWPDGKGGDEGSQYGLTLETDPEGTPSSTSAALDAGLDLSSFWKGKPLPGCEKGYFKGKAPDVGAVEVK